MQKTERFELRMDAASAALLGQIANNTGYTKSEVVRLALGTFANHLEHEARLGVRYGPKNQEENYPTTPPAQPTQLECQAEPIPF